MMYLIVGLFMVLDIATGLIQAFKEKKYTSKVMREGLFHKCGSILCVLFSVLVNETQKFFDLSINLPIINAICSYIILMECGSIIENIGSINPQIVPEKIKGYFDKLKG